MRFLLYYVILCFKNRLLLPSNWFILQHLLFFQMRRFKTTEEIDMDDEDIEFIVQQVLCIKQ